MAIYQVNYNATYWVSAPNEEDAIEKAIQVHQELPDGDWEAFVDPYESEDN